MCVPKLLESLRKSHLATEAKVSPLATEAKVSPLATEAKVSPLADSFIHALQLCQSIILCWFVALRREFNKNDSFLHRLM